MKLMCVLNEQIIPQSPYDEEVSFDLENEEEVETVIATERQKRSLSTTNERKKTPSQIHSASESSDREGSGRHSYVLTTDYERSTSPTSLLVDYLTDVENDINAVVDGRVVTTDRRPQSAGERERGLPKTGAKNPISGVNVSSEYARDGSRADRQRAGSVGAAQGSRWGPSRSNLLP